MTLLAEKNTFTYPPGSGIRSPKIVQMTTSFSGSVGFDVEHLLAEHETVTSATASVDPTGPPTTGTVTIGNDAHTIKVPFGSDTISIGEYVMTVVVTPTDTQVFSVEGLIVVDA